MENEELLRRLSDLGGRCEKRGEVCQSHFLSPAEQAQAQRWACRDCGCTFLLSGGREECERKAAFFLPEYMEPESFEPGEYISCIRYRAAFGEPGHRDYLGAAMALGIDRQWLGDIWVNGKTAYIFCQPSVEKHLLLSLDKAGRTGVRGEKISLCDAEAPERRVERLSFTVQSPRLDAVAAGMFRISRSEAAKHIAQGLLSLNYEPCVRCDVQLKPGDILSLRGFGKGNIAEYGGQSRKGRLFIDAEVWK